MAQYVNYGGQVITELANAYDAARRFSPCSDHIEWATKLVSEGKPIVDVMEDIICAMKHSTNEKVLYSLSQAIAWIGPMGE